MPPIIRLLNWMGEPYKEWLVPFEKGDLIARARWRTGLHDLWGQKELCHAACLRMPSCTFARMLQESSAAFAYWNAGLDALLADVNDSSTPLQVGVSACLSVRHVVCPALPARVHVSACTVCLHARWCMQRTLFGRFAFREQLLTGLCAQMCVRVCLWVRVRAYACV
jgi:hypothetical protein